MRAFLLIIVLMALALSTSAPAKVVEVPLPELRGRYYPGDTTTRYASFQMDPAPLSIAGVSIRLTGTHTLGEIWCETTAGFMVPQPYPADFYASIWDTVNGYWWLASLGTLLPSGDFEITIARPLSRPM